MENMVADKIELLEKELGMMPMKKYGGSKCNNV